MLPQSTIAYYITQDNNEHFHVDLWQNAPNTGCKLHKLIQYIFSDQGYWYRRIVILALITLALIFLIPENMIPIVYVRYLLGLFLVIFLPGYTLGHAFQFASYSESSKKIQQIGLSISLSLALTITTGFFLSVTPIGLRTSTITLSLIALTIIFSTIAIQREQKKSSNEQNHHTE